MADKKLVTAESFYQGVGKNRKIVPAGTSVSAKDLGVSAEEFEALEKRGALRGDGVSVAASGPGIDVHAELKQAQSEREQLRAELEALKAGNK